jgi:hypothetical protein
MGSKYQPSIKDQKATLRFHTNTKREKAKAAGASLYVPPQAPRKLPATGGAGENRLKDGEPRVPKSD